MNKRKSDESRMPIVEKLYRKNQVSYECAGGFDADDDAYEETRERISEAVQKKRDRPFGSLVVPDNCKECEKPLYDSFLWQKFNHPVCDNCRDDKNAHKLIARTEAKKEYLLKDCDLDLRKPLLRFIAKKNPHNPRYGDMKLYLKLQVERRALEIYDSLSHLEEVKEQRAQNHEILVEKRFEKKIKQMRKDISGLSNMKLTTSDKHEHEFDDSGETYNAKTKTFSKTCTICGFQSSYEKL